VNKYLVNGLIPKGHAVLLLGQPHSIKSWLEELTTLKALDDNLDTVWKSFWNNLQELDQHFNYGFIISKEQKKQILNLLLKEFVLYNDGKIELWFKLPVNEKQVAETVATLSKGDKSTYE
jgi:hypothetical protein